MNFHKNASPKAIKYVESRIAAGKDLDVTEVVGVLTGLQSGEDFAFAHQTQDYVCKKLGLFFSQATDDFVLPANRVEEFAAEFTRLASPKCYSTI